MNQFEKELQLIYDLSSFAGSKGWHLAIRRWTADGVRYAQAWFADDDENRYGDDIETTLSAALQNLKAQYMPEDSC